MPTVNKPFGLDIIARGDQGYNSAGITIGPSTVILDGSAAPCCLIVQKQLQYGTIRVDFTGKLLPDEFANALSIWVYSDAPGARQPEYTDFEPCMWGDPNNPTPINLSCWTSKLESEMKRSKFPSNQFTRHSVYIGLYPDKCRIRADGYRNADDKSGTNYAYAEFGVPFTPEGHTLRIGCIFDKVAQFRGPARYEITNIQFLP